MKNTKIIFFGDVYCSEYSEVNIDRKLMNVISDHLHISVNLEGPIINSKCSKNSKTGPHIHQHISVLSFLKKINCTIVSLANNHIYDYGFNGLNNTLIHLKKYICLGAGINYKNAYKLNILYLNGTKVGLLSFAEAEFGFSRNDTKDSSGFAWINNPDTTKIIIESKKIVDILFVQIHCGIEEVFLPLPEWTYVFKSIIDIGADVIIGHHPHVVQSYERYKNKYIFYSLGNFYFDTQLISDSTSFGFGVSFNIKKKKISSFKLIPVEAKRNYIGLANKKIIAKINKKIAILHGVNYYNEINLIAKKLFKERYLPYYWQALSGINHSNFSLQLIFMFIKNILKINLVDPLFLIHNIRIESHRWIVERALDLQVKSQKK